MLVLRSWSSTLLWGHDDLVYHMWGLALCATDRLRNLRYVDLLYMVRADGSYFDFDMPPKLQATFASGGIKIPSGLKIATHV